VAEIQATYSSEAEPDWHQQLPIRLQWKTCNGASKTFFGGNGLFSSVLGLARNNLYLWQLFYFKNKPLQLIPTVLQM
jgi:hypothetical protein